MADYIMPSQETVTQDVKKESSVNVTHRRLLELVSYDPVTGAFRKKHGRQYISIDGIHYRTSRLAWFYMTGKWPTNYIDHKNGDVADDSFENLREATHAQNMQNLALSNKNTSGYHGVYLCSTTNKWRAEITANGKRHKLGRFDTREEAAAAYLRAKTQLHGFQPKPRDID